MSAYEEIKQAAWRTNQEPHRSGLAPRTFGNVSALDRARGVFAIKPSGIAYDAMCVEDIVVVDLQGVIVDGIRRPSSDTRTHAVLYRAFPHIAGVAHCHSPYAVAWAQAATPIPLLGTTHADLTAHDIPCTDELTDAMIQGNYEEETGHLIVRRFAHLSPDDVPMVLVANHGPFTWGETPDAAVENSILLEEVARLAFWTLQIRPGTPPLRETLRRKHYERKHGDHAYYGQKED